MADKNTFNANVESLFKGMDAFLTTKTVVGDAVRFDDGTIVLPLVDVSFGVGAGAFVKENEKNSSGGGIGGKMTPSSVLVIKDGCTKLVNVRNQDVMTKVLDMVPDLINKFVKSEGGSEEENPEVAKTVETMINPDKTEE